MSETKNPIALIVEDDSKLAEIFTQAIKMAGYEIRLAVNAQKAFDLLAVCVPAIILLDLHLPDGSGEKILIHIRQVDHLKNSIVILNTSDSIMADALREQSDFVLLKPVSFSQLRDLAVRLRPGG